MIYNIIEDCSPYYIRFTFDRLDAIIEYVRTLSPIDIKQYRDYTHDTLSIDHASNIVSMLPMANELNFNINRVAVFTTPPGGGCGIHKDGLTHRMSLNIPIEILDNDCITNWYTDEEFDGLPVPNGSTYTRNVYYDYKTMDKFTPIKTMVAQKNEMMLFNTEIYHSWNNIKSSNKRRILTLRSVNPGTVYFDDVKKILNLQRD